MLELFLAGISFTGGLIVVVLLQKWIHARALRGLLEDFEELAKTSAVKGKLRAKSSSCKGEE